MFFSVLVDLIIKIRFTFYLGYTNQPSSKRRGGSTIPEGDTKGFLEKLRNNISVN